MYNLGDDKELDRLSREAAGSYTPPSEANWQVLSEELDKVLPVEEKKRRTFFFWWLLPLLLIGGGLTWWLLPEKSSTASQQESATVVPLQNNTAASGNSASSELSSPNNQGVVTEPITKPEETAITSKDNTNNSSEALSGISQPKKSVTGLTNTLFNRKPLTTSGATKRTSSPTSLVKNDLAKQEEAGTSTNTTKVVTPITTAPDLASVKTSMTAEKTTVVTDEKENNTATITREETKIETTVNTPLPVTENELVVVLKKVRKNGFSFGILAGVDKSTVKFKYSNDAGVNVGILGGYHINPKWSVHSGILYTRKNYKVAGEDFTAPKGTPISYYKLEDVTGYCAMWEIPLLVRYAISNGVKNNVFLSTGLSSYFMNRENYDYFYYFNGQPVIRHGSPSTTNNPILSILHLSAGFEKKLSSNWSLQIEPYAKLPLGGVGFGDIRLSSFGLNFSAQFRQLSKK